MNVLIWNICIHNVLIKKSIGHTNTVKAFLKAGVDPNLRSSDGKSCADMTQNKATLKLLDSWKDKSNNLEKDKGSKDGKTVSGSDDAL